MSKEPELIQCPKCGSTDVVKRGVVENQRGPTQRHGCKSCGYRFTIDLFKGKRVEPETIASSIALYFCGLSLKRVGYVMWQCLGKECSQITVFNWIFEYTPKVASFLRRIKVSTGETWQFGGKPIRVGGEKRTLFVVMDRSTRFILSALISLGEIQQDAVDALRYASELARTPPKVIESGAWEGYGKAITTIFGNSVSHSPSPDENSDISWLSQLTGVAGRLYGSKLRDMCGLKSKEKAQHIIDGLTTSHNYVWPNMALDEKTPSEVAGAQVELDRNRWLSLLNKSLQVIG